MVTLKTSAAPSQCAAGKEQSLARLLEQGFARGGGALKR